MLYTPRGINAFISAKALEMEKDSGTLMIEIVTDWAYKNGFTCSHPEYAQKLHKGAKPSINKLPIFKCLICGEKYQKGKNGERIK